MATLLTEFCNIYGAETGGIGKGQMLGGLSDPGTAPSRQWYCPTRAVGHYIMKCPHGHKGQMMPLCEKHAAQYKKAVSFCPPCNTMPPGHKCQIVLTEIS